MRIFAVILVLALAAGCASRSKARLQAQQQILASQNAIMKKQLASQMNGVTVIGEVQNSFVPYVVGLNLVQVIATANYLGAEDPKEIIITRHGETASLEPDVLLNGAAVPMEPGDVVEIR